VANAFIGPIIASYLTRLERELQARGFTGTVFLMQSNGGVASVATTRSTPVTTVLSGPASAPAAAAFYCDAYGLKDVITVDMGGTSFDACLIKDGMPALMYDGELGGHRIKTPMVDVHVIGAGGGSIAWLDAGGLLRVGPSSAGAVPGPACYGAGGIEPTVTDANLVLGYLDPTFFLGGRLLLHRDAAVQAIRSRIARPLGLDVVEAAWGIVRVVTSNMADGIEKISVRRGDDPREFHLIVGGGAGPTHAGMIAQEMDIPRILIPASASVLCAFGMLASSLKHCYVRTCMFPVSAIAASSARAIWRAMRDEALATLRREGADAATVRLTYAADLRYAGQAYELEVELDEEDAYHGEAPRIAERFHRAHDAIYGYADRAVDIECVNVRLTATTARRHVELPRLPHAGEDPSAARKGRRTAYFDAKGMMDTPVFDGARLAYGHVIEGPALVERVDTTVVVPPAFRLVCDEWGNYQLSSWRESA
jgi:N-methylhydantoinase A